MTVSTDANFKSIDQKKLKIISKLLKDNQNLPMESNFLYLTK